MSRPVDVPISWVIAVTSVVCAAGVSLTIGRFFLHRKSAAGALPNPGAGWRKWADYANGAAAVVLVAYVVLHCSQRPRLETISAAAKSGATPALATIRWVYQIHFAYSSLFWSTLCLAKFSLLLLYRSIFAISKNFTRAWWAITVFTAMTYGVHMLDTLWMCGAPRDLFTAECLNKAHRKSRVDVVIVDATLHLTSAFAIMALALAMLPGLRMRRGRKAGLAAIFLLTLLDVAFDLARIAAVLQPGVNLLFTFLEPALAVVVCALPVYGRAWARAARWVRPGKSAGSRGSSSAAASDASKSRLPLRLSSGLSSIEGSRPSAVLTCSETRTGESQTHLFKAFEYRPANRSDSLLTPSSVHDVAEGASAPRAHELV